MGAIKFHDFIYLCLLILVISQLPYAAIGCALMVFK